MFLFVTPLINMDTRYGVQNEVRLVLSLLQMLFLVLATHMPNSQFQASSRMWPRRCFSPLALSPLPWRRCVPVPISMFWVRHLKYLLYSQSLSTPSSVCPSQLFDLLNYTSECNLSTTHLNVVDSLALLSTSIPNDASTSEVTNSSQVPRTLREALSPAFVDVWGPAVDSELSGFQKYQCFQPVPVPPEGIRTIPGHWLFSVKRNGTPKARFVMGGHRQRIGIG